MEGNRETGDVRVVFGGGRLRERGGGWGRLGG